MTGRLFPLELDKWSRGKAWADKPTVEGHNLAKNTANATKIENNTKNQSRPSHFTIAWGSY